MSRVEGDLQIVVGLPCRGRVRTNGNRKDGAVLVHQREIQGKLEVGIPNVDGQIRGSFEIIDTERGFLLWIVKEHLLHVCYKNMLVG